MENSTTPTEDTIARIEKLLNLAARAGTEGEATAAFAAASKLMTKYGIEQHQLGKKKEDTAAVTRVDLNKTWRTERPAHAWVRAVISHCFKVHVIKVRGPNYVKYYLVGQPADCAFAAYAFEVLCDTFLRLQNVYLTTYNKPRVPVVYNGYFKGLFQGFCHAWDDAQRAEMVAQKAESYALVLVDKERAIVAYCENTGVKSAKLKRSIDGHAAGVGYRDGRNIKISRALST